MLSIAAAVAPLNPHIKCLLSWLSLLYGFAMQISSNNIQTTVHHFTCWFRHYPYAHLHFLVCVGQLILCSINVAVNMHCGQQAVATGHLLRRGSCIYHRTCINSVCHLVETSFWLSTLLRSYVYYIHICICICYQYIFICVCVGCIIIFWSRVWNTATLKNLPPYNEYGTLILRTLGTF